MGLRRPGATKDYEEMPGTNLPIQSKNNHHINNHHHHHPQRNSLHHADLVNHTICQDLEMSSVSVVPDGKYIFSYQKKLRVH